MLTHRKITEVSTSHPLATTHTSATSSILAHSKLLFQLVALWLIQNYCLFFQYINYWFVQCFLKVFFLVKGTFKAISYQPKEYVMTCPKYYLNPQSDTTYCNSNSSCKVTVQNQITSIKLKLSFNWYNCFKSCLRYISLKRSAN